VFAAVIITVLPQHLWGVYLAPDRRAKGSGCKCQPLNSRVLRLNLSVALLEACTQPDYITADRQPQEAVAAGNNRCIN